MTHTQRFNIDLRSASLACEARGALFTTFCQIAEIVIIGLHELPDNWNREDHNKADGGPDRNGVVAHSIEFRSDDLNGKASGKTIICAI